MSALRLRLIDPTFLFVVLLGAFAWAPLTYPGSIETHMGLLPPRGTSLPPAWARPAFAVALIGGSVGLYGWTRGALGRGGGLLAALVYAYLPFTLATVYVRGDVADALCIGLLPWALWLARGVFRRPAVAWGMALLVMLLLLVSGGLADRWGAPDDVAAHAVYPFQLFAAGWGDGISVAGWQDTLPLGLGMAALAALGLMVGWPPEMQLAQRVALGIVLVVILLSTTLAAPLWQRLPPGRLLAWPWQLHLLAGPFLALLAGGALPALLSKLTPEARAAWGLPVQAILVAIVILAATPALSPRFTRFMPVADPVIFGDEQVALLEVYMDAAPAPDQTVRVHAVWQAIRPLDFDYNVFVHVLDGDDRVAQVDVQPQDGERPMTTWRVGELIEDTYELAIPADAPAAGYHVVVGVYNWQTGAWLAADTGEDAADVIEVRGPVE